MISFILAYQLLTMLSAKNFVRKIFGDLSGALLSNVRLAGYNGAGADG
jgi:hypothetical protein